jgi:hypothetical protein
MRRNVLAGKAALPRHATLSRGRCHARRYSPSLRDFIRTNLVGAVALETSKAALTDLVKATSEYGVPNVLLDTRMAVAVGISASDVSSLVVHLLALGIDPEFRIAILNDPHDEIDRGKIFEKHARRRGIDAAVFRDFESALSWLCKFPSKPRC